MKEELKNQVSRYYVLMKHAVEWSEKYGFYHSDENDGLSFDELFEKEITDVLENKEMIYPPKTISLLKQIENEAEKDGFFPHGLLGRLAQTFFDHLEYLLNI